MKLMARAEQLPLFGASPDLPEGFAYQPQFVSPDEERELIARLAEVPFAPFQFRGYEGRRRVFSFGWRYDFDGAGLVQVDPIPDWLLPLRDRAAEFAGLAPEAFAHVLLTEYGEGARIGWHRDRPAFERVVGISLASPCVMQLRRWAGTRFERRAVTLAPRSAYRLLGSARSEWEHAIPAVTSLRYSITFRNLHSSGGSPR